jgi:predicted metal-dependent hydrolase
MDLLFRRGRAASFPEATEIVLDGRTVTIAIRVSPRARAYRLTLPANGRPILTVPAHGRWPEAADFLGRQRHWLAARLKRAPASRRFADGETVPLRGVPFRIIGRNALRGRVEIVDFGDGSALDVPGGPDHLARRLTDWLKKQAENDLRERVDHHAARLGVRPTGLTLRSQSTRWGSCSSAGRLNFNWRLIMAPPFVLDYVAAHEVAHMLEMNHSPAFWKTVERTLPDMRRGKSWLKAHGQGLMAYDAA